MATEAGHSAEIAASEYTGNSLPADEDTPLLREASSTSRKLRCCEHFNCRHFLLICLSLLSFAEVLILIASVIPVTINHIDEIAGALLNVVDTMNCCLFLIIIVKSPSFVGFSAVVKDLCCLPNFWTLFLFFLFYLIGVSLNICSLSKICSLYVSDLDRAPDCNVPTSLFVNMILEILNFFSLMILVVVLNDTKLRCTIRGHAWVYRMLKGTLIMFCFRLFVPVASSIMTTNIPSISKLGSKYVQRDLIIKNILFLPFGEKVVELLWKKIFLDDKCIVGKINRNRGTRQITFVV